MEVEGGVSFFFSKGEKHWENHGKTVDYVFFLRFVEDQFFFEVDLDFSGKEWTRFGQ